MAGTLIVSNITTDTDNTFIVRSNTGTTLFTANTTGIDTANSIATNAITSDKILSVANTKISGNIVSSQITSVANTQITGNIASSQIAPTLSLYGTTSLGRDTTDYVNIVGGSGTARVDATGGNTDVNLSLATKGTGSTYFWRGGYGGTQMALINQYGLGLGATTPSSGTGIAFPATQNVSSNANTLDDYETGTFTPVLSFGGNSVGITYSAQQGAYVKIGKFVHIQMYINLSSKGSSTGTAAVLNLPFASGSNAYAGAAVSHWGSISGVTFVGSYIPPGSAYINISGGNPAPSTNSSLSDTNFGAGSYFIFSITYQSA